MSRSYPFPPPGYVLKESPDKALIESIKGEEEKAKKEQRRKERKREKKEKKKKEKNENKEKEKKEKKRKEREGVDGESEKHSHRRHRKEEVTKGVQNQKVDVFPKLKETKNDCLEKSILTVEPQLLQSTSQNSCDSTLNSNELPKPKEKQPLDGRHKNDSESIIRIRLPIQRQKDPEVMLMTNKGQQKPCPSRETKLDISQDVSRAQPTEQQNPCSTSAPQQASKSHERKRKDKEKKMSSSTQETSQPSSLCRKCPPSMAVQLLNLVEDWVPNTMEKRLELTNSEDEECWWSIKKPSGHKFGTERCKQLDTNNETREVENSSMVWPQTRLLPEADVHALPYTVLF